jgi:hypothetical protein
MSILNTAALKVFPTSASGIDVTSGPSTNTFGAWTEIVPASSFASPVQMAGYMIQGYAASATFELQVGTGTAGNEVAIANIPQISSNGNENIQITMLPTAINLGSANARISFRMRHANANTTLPFAMFYYLSSTATTAADEMSYLPYGVLGVNQGTAIVPNTTPWANSSWTELSPSLASGTRIIGVMPALNSFYVSMEYELDIGTGALGAETVITTIRNNFAPVAIQGLTNVYLPAVYTLPGTSRVSYRLRKSGTDPSTFYVFLIYLPASDLVADIDSIGCGLTTNQILAFGTNLDIASDISVTRDGDEVEFSVTMATADQLQIDIPDYVNGEYCVALGEGTPVCAELECAPPQVTAANWRLHRFDLKQRLEQTS